MTLFFDAHHGEYGSQPICRELPIAPSTYYERWAREVDRGRLPTRARRDERLREHIGRVWEEKDIWLRPLRRDWQRTLNR